MPKESNQVLVFVFLLKDLQKPNKHGVKSIPPFSALNKIATQWRNSFLEVYFFFYIQSLNYSHYVQVSDPDHTMNRLFLKGHMSTF